MNSGVTKVCVGWVQAQAIFFNASSTLYLIAALTNLLNLAMPLNKN